MATLFIFLFLYKALFFLVARPVGRLVWTQALLRSPAGHITNNNMAEVFKSPVIWLALFVLLLGLSVWTLVEVSVIITGMDLVRRGEGPWGENDKAEKIKERDGKAWRIQERDGKAWRVQERDGKVWQVQKKFAWLKPAGKQVKVLARKQWEEMDGLLRRSISNIRHVLRPENYPMVLFTVAVLPFTNLLLASEFVSRIVSPKYILQHITSGLFPFIGFWAAVFAMVFWMVEWLFVFHYFVLERCSFAKAVRSSVRLVSGRQFRSMRRVVWRRFVFGLEMYLVGTLGVGAAYAAMHVLKNDFSNIFPVEQISYRYLYLPVFLFLYSCIMTFVHYDSLATLYYEFVWQSGRGRNSIDWTGKKTVWQFHREGRILAGGMAVLMMVCSLFTMALVAHTSLLDEFVQNPTAVTAHRGYSSAAPENTLPAFLYAIDCQKADYVELDVQETADGIPVVAHDVSLKRNTGRNVKVSDLLYAELSTLDASKGYTGPGASEFAGTAIPSLEEVIRACQGKIKLNIEIKEGTPNLTEKVVNMINKYGIKEDCAISSSRYSVLEKAKELEPELECGYILSMGAGSYYDLPAADFFSIEASFVTREIVNELHLRGKEVHAWTVNHTKTLEKMLQYGVDNIITDEPELVFDYIQEVNGLSLDEGFLFPAEDGGPEGDRTWRE